MTRKTTPPSRLAIFTCAFATGLLAIVVALVTPIWDRLQNLGFDRQTAVSLQGEAPDDVVLVSMDSASHERLNQSGIDAWDTTLHADLLRRLIADGAALVVFDIYFSPQISSPGDARLSELITDPSYDSAVVFAAVAEATFPNFDAPVHFQTVNPSGLTVDPPRFANANHDNWGIVNLWNSGVDADFAVRRMPALVPPGTNIEPLMGVRRLERVAVERLNETKGDSSPTPQAPSGAWIRYRTAPRNYMTVSYVDAYRGDCAPGTFRDKIVFIGGSRISGFTGTMKDVYAAPFIQGNTATGSIQGVELLAQLFENYRQKDWLVSIPNWIQVAGLLACLAVFTIVLAFLPVRMIAILAVIGAVAWYYLIPALASEAGVLFNWMFFPVVFVPVTSITVGTFKLFAEHWEKRLFQREFEKYVPPQVAAVIARDHEIESKECEATVMMTDLADFTTLADNTKPSQLIDILHDYFNDVVEVIFAHGGTVINYTGDAVLAVWGAPLPDDNQSVRAITAAEEVVRKTYQKKYFAHYLKTRIGITRGKVLAGNIGSDDRINYAITGDPVNLSSRLQGLSKHLGTTILFSEPVFANQGEHAFQTRFVGNFILAGKEKSVPVHQLFTVRDTEMSNPDRKLFEDGVACFFRDEKERARELFEKVGQDSADSVTQFYLARMSDPNFPDGSTSGISVSK